MVNCMASVCCFYGILWDLKGRLGDVYGMLMGFYGMFMGC